jgi:hypothetical protein
MTDVAKPAPVIVDDVPTCDLRCAYYSKPDDGWARCTIKPEQTNAVAFGPCLPAIAEEHRSLARLRTQMKSVVAEVEHTGPGRLGRTIAWCDFCDNVEIGTTVKHRDDCPLALKEPT